MTKTTTEPIFQTVRRPKYRQSVTHLAASLLIAGVIVTGVGAWAASPAGEEHPSTPPATTSPTVTPLR